jgi:hypothetical protein
MSTHRQDRIDRAGAERLLDSIARQSAQTTDPLADLLRAVVPAPEHDRQLPGEAAAVDAFHHAVTVPAQAAVPGQAGAPRHATAPGSDAALSAPSNPAAAPRRRHAQRRSLRPISFAVRVIAATVVLASAGVAVANAAGVLPGHRDGTRPHSSASATAPTSVRTDNGSPTTQVPPTDGATPGSAVAPGQSPGSSSGPSSSSTPGSNGNSVAALCHRFLRDDDAARAKDLQTPSFQRVIDAAGGSGNVADYCATNYPHSPAQTKSEAPQPSHSPEPAKTNGNRATSSSATSKTATSKTATSKSASSKSGKS